MASYDKAIESYKNAIPGAASVAAWRTRWCRPRWHASPLHTIVVEQRTDGLISNHVYGAVKTYLATSIATDRQQCLRVSSTDESETMLVSMAEGEEMADVFDGAALHLPQGHQRLGKITPDTHYMNQFPDIWSPVDFRHPSTFGTLAMDQKLKQSIIDDLDRFIKRKDYYKRIGKAWKRGYLLYGPPGTGKSSLIAAMANHLRFDVYDLDLTEVQSNSDLRRLLIGMRNRSIIVAEDIDCSI
ncbi:hypothetical protein SETIT_1G208900v2 [Setaria italica]|uniref:ATPase AAA-type core domain-containing protein n=1 Tax=Setaria italica TaxID=4555 RepID=A0A368PMI6_SETIT|nr:hypothetical protein SETIT_1G208900v2 [Setaria italica]